MSDVTPPEIWIPVPDYEGLYRISSIGHAYSVKRNGTLGGVLKPRISRTGYLQVSLSKNNRSKTFTIHHLVATAFFGPLPPGQVIRHLDDNKLNNTIANLAFGTYKENREDSYQNWAPFTIRKEFCKYGHEFTPENTYIYRWGKGDGRVRRQCRTCNKIREDARTERRRQARLDPDLAKAA